MRNTYFGLHNGNVHFSEVPIYPLFPPGLGFFCFPDTTPLPEIVKPLMEASSLLVGVGPHLFSVRSPCGREPACLVEGLTQSHPPPQKHTTTPPAPPPPPLGSAIPSLKAGFPISSEAAGLFLFLFLQSLFSPGQDPLPPSCVDDLPQPHFGFSPLERQ